MIPDHETVKQIMNEVYNKFYLKWRNTLTQENASEMMQDVRDIEKFYPYDLCSSNLLSLVECIEEEYRRRL
ncbi:MAG: hypothetical protein K0S76_1885 [Herbinix sp.]|jgi:hypothetical protein|nr:hypothetical protein [Herbinix sp.]